MLKFRQTALIREEKPKKETIEKLRKKLKKREITLFFQKLVWNRLHNSNCKSYLKKQK